IFAVVALTIEERLALRVLERARRLHHDDGTIRIRQLGGVRDRGGEAIAINGDHLLLLLLVDRAQHLILLLVSFRETNPVNRRRGSWLGFCRWKQRSQETDQQKTKSLHIV